MLLHIQSRHNPLYKRLMRLRKGKTASPDELSSLILLEGVHLCQDWLHHRGLPEQAVFDGDLLQTSSELQDLVRHVGHTNAVTMSPALLKSLSYVVTGQGVFFLVRHYPAVMPDHIDHPCLWLDRVQDPGNVGTLLRTAAAAGIKHAYLSRECASVWSPRVLRSAQGAHFSMTIHENLDLTKTCQRLRIPLFATAVDATATSLYQSKLLEPCAWVFGNEGQGVEPALLELADQKVFIPQASATESLNVAVAAAICLFEQRRQQLNAV